MESTSHSNDEINILKKYMFTIKGKVVTVPYYQGQSSTKIKELIKDQ